VARARSASCRRDSSLAGSRPSAVCAALAAVHLHHRTSVTWISSRSSPRSEENRPIRTPHDREITVDREKRIVGPRTSLLLRRGIEPSGQNRLRVLPLRSRRAPHVMASLTSSPSRNMTVNSAAVLTRFPATRFVDLFFLWREGALATSKNCSISRARKFDVGVHIMGLAAR